MAAARTGGDDLTENWASDEAQVNKKRKHDNPTAAQPAATSKPKKIKTKHIPATARPSADQPATAGSQRALCFHSADEQATGFWQLYLQSKGGKLLTTIEQDENVPASAIVLPSVSTSKAANDSSHPLTALPAHLRSSLGAATARRLTSPPAVPPTTNQPLVLVVCSSAIRCTDYIKAMRALHLPPDSLLKAFAKHIKLAEQQAQLDSSDVRLAVGTPKRLLDLMVGGALRVERLVLLVVDCKEDAKKYSLLTLPGVKDDFFALYQLLHSAVRAGKIKLTLF